MLPKLSKSQKEAVKSFYNLAGVDGAEINYRMQLKTAADCRSLIKEIDRLKVLLQKAGVKFD